MKKPRHSDLLFDLALFAMFAIPIAGITIAVLVANFSERWGFAIFLLSCLGWIAATAWNEYLIDTEWD
jgi:cyanate permease